MISQINDETKHDAVKTNDGMKKKTQKNLTGNGDSFYSIIQLFIGSFPIRIYLKLLRVFAR